MLANREEYYWWHRARRMMCAKLLIKCNLSPGARCLDLGSGTGGNFILTSILKSDIAIGLDISPIAHAETRKKFPNAHLVSADLSKTLPFEDSKFDLITIFNVLYHDWVADERNVVKEAARVLKPGGILVITEPAFEILSREMDIIAMGHRRYLRADLVTWCKNSGLEVKYSSYFTCFGFPLLLGIKLFRKIRPEKSSQSSNPVLDMRPLNPLFNEILRLFAQLETFFIVRGFCIPFGTTILCLAQLPKDNTHG